MNKPKLIIFEGFDRTGKDTLLKRLETSNLGTPYIQLENDEAKPNYREDPNGFYKYLETYLDRQVNDLIELSKTSNTIFLSRFFLSDYVYSQLFNRPKVVDKFKQRLEEHFDIENVIFLWKTYADYNLRCLTCQCAIEYNKMEFDRIQSMFLKYAKDSNYYTNVLYIEEKDSTDDVYNMFLSRTNFDHNKKIIDMFNLFFDLDKNHSLNVLKTLMLTDRELVNKGFIFAGIGKNWYICEKLTKTFLSMGLKAQSLDPVHALHGDLGMIDGQTIFFISKSGTTKELISLVKILRELNIQGIKKCKLVGFYLNNKITNDDKLYDLLIVPSDAYCNDKIYEFDTNNIVPTLSINIMQMVLDKFGVEIFEHYPDLVTNYKYNHLGGDNGRKLGVDVWLNQITK